jgi:predicted short-subunit dehydrogenase-like oxidoreductase (DUF2520 family)
MSGQLTIIGAGRVGLSLALDLATPLRFERVTVVGRARETPSLLGARTGIAYRSVPRDGLIPEPPLPEEALDGSLMFCVSDDDLGPVAAAWGEALRPHGPAAVRHAVHTSGLHTGEALASLRDSGASIASWHPIIAISRPRRGAFRLVTFGIEGDPDATAWAQALTQDLGAESILVEPSAKSLYHVAAVYGSNYLVACLAVACAHLERSLADGYLADGYPADGSPAAAGSGSGGYEVEPGLRHLLPLARSALENLAESGLARGATGPVARGDVGTVERHLEALDPRARSLYRLLGAELLRLLEGQLPDDVRAPMRELLGTGEEGESSPEEGSAVDDE